MALKKTEGGLDFVELMNLDGEIIEILLSRETEKVDEVVIPEPWYGWFSWERGNNDS